MQRPPNSHPTTPDGRYFVVRGRLWRCSNPALPVEEREKLVHDLMRYRREVRRAKSMGDAEALAAARRGVHAAKVALGERGPVWWTDGSPDYNRRMVRGTPYAAWFGDLDQGPEGSSLMPPGGSTDDSAP